MAHVLLAVPDYKGDSSRKLSYLRLGEAFGDIVGADGNQRGEADRSTTGTSVDATLSGNWGSTGRGDDLLFDSSQKPRSYLGFCDDERPGFSAEATAFGTAYAGTGASYRYDDGTTATAAADPNTFTEALLTRGGWREHTDGNRISTTRGDCVEVVGGNYKLVVLGRVNAGTGPLDVNTDNPHLPIVASWEAAGGFWHDRRNAGSEITSIAWDATKNRWQITETTERTYSIDEFSGDKEELFFGDSITVDIGTGDATEANFNQAAPAIVESTTANEIQTRVYTANYSSTVGAPAFSNRKSRPRSFVENITLQTSDKLFLDASRITEQIRASMTYADWTYADTIVKNIAYSRKNILQFTGVSIGTSMVREAHNYKGTQISLAYAAEFGVFIGSKLTLTAAVPIDLSLDLRNKSEVILCRVFEGVVFSAKQELQALKAAGRAGKLAGAGMAGGVGLTALAAAQVVTGGLGLLLYLPEAVAFGVADLARLSLPRAPPSESWILDEATTAINNLKSGQQRIVSWVRSIN